MFVIVLENHDWSDFKNSPDAPFINSTLLPIASHCEQYYNPPGIHPSLPNYLWMEAGTNFGIFDDNDPAQDHQATTNHLVSLLQRAGVSWKAYQEDISGGYIPLNNTNLYAVRHDPFVYFDDVTGTNNPSYAYGIAHIRPYSELAGDLASNTVARYNFITPNVCDDGHDSCYPLYNPVRQTDNWLAGEVPKILNSAAYSNNGALFITWDEAASGDGPIGMIALSPLARAGGYFNNVHYTHSSLIRTLQEIFGVTPLLNDAANAPDLSDLFSRFAIAQISRLTNAAIQISTSGVIPGKTNYIQASPNLTDWISINTNIVATNNFSFVDSSATNSAARFYRVLQLP